ncbi:MAG: DUF5666 domain-containing protein [Paracoccaceae bacterium]
MSQAFRPHRRAVLTGLAAAIAGGCARTDAVLDGLVREDGRKPAEGGIGGTGIIGVVTALGSIRVNGLRVGFTPETRIEDVLGARSRASLRSGQSVTVEAAGLGRDLVAARVRVDYPLVGAIDRVAGDGRSLTVLGTEVVLEPLAVALAGVGDRVAVSGLWDGDRVIAARVDLLRDDGPEAMAGVLRADGRLGGLYPLAAAGTLPEAGRFVTLTGRRDGERFVVASAREGRFEGAAGPLARLSVEGFLEPVRSAPGVAVSGLGHSFDRGADLSGVGARRGLFVGPYTGEFEVEAVLPLPSAARERADLLSGLADIRSADGVIRTR